MESVVPFIADTVRFDGAVPVLYVLTEEDMFEFGVVHVDPESALKTNVYVVPEIRPDTVIGLAVPDASENEDPPLIEY